MGDGICNIASSVPAQAARNPHGMAVLFPEGRGRSGRVRYTHYTYRQLDEESNRLAAGLRAIGIARGSRTVVMVKPSLEFFALTFALFKLGAVPVLIDPGMGVGNLGRCLAEAEPEAFIGIPKANLARLLLGWGRRTIRIRVLVGAGWLPNGYSLRRIRSLGADAANILAATGAEDTAAILFTSGSTGVPKGAVYTHGTFTAQVDMLRQSFGIEPGEIDLCTFPLFALFAPALAMAAVIPDMDATRPARVDPRKIIQAVADFGVTNLFGSPALLKRVGEYCEDRSIRFPTLRRVISAGAPVSFRILECWEKLLAPGVQIFTPYGATEVLPVSVIGSKEVLTETAACTAAGAGVCVGRPVAPNQVAVIRITDEPLPEWRENFCVPNGEIGEIAVRGPVATREYYGRPAATQLAKIPLPEGGDFYHRMGDVGYLDDRGRLWFCGRKSQRVVTEHGTLFTIPCEAVFNNHPLVARTALVRVAKRPVICVELRPGVRREAWPRLEAELRELAAGASHTRNISTFLHYPRPFPVDIRHNAKIFREKLAAWAARQVA